MKGEDEDGMGEAGDVPASALLCERTNQYGSVPGLDDDELADPRELERQVMLQEWGPILLLPNRHEPRGIRPAIDEEGRVDWGAFASVDFERTMPAFDKARYKADKLKDQAENALIILGIVQRRLPDGARGLVLKYLRLGIIDEEHIVNEDMRAFVRLQARADRLQRQISELRGVSQARLRQEMAWLLS